MPVMQEKFDKMVWQVGKTTSQSLEEQLFIFEVNPTDHSFYCCFTGPIRVNIICLLKEGESIVTCHPIVKNKHASHT